MTITRQIKMCWLTLHTESWNTESHDEIHNSRDGVWSVKKLRTLFFNWVSSNFFETIINLMGFFFFHVQPNTIHICPGSFIFHTMKQIVLKLFIPMPPIVTIIFLHLPKEINVIPDHIIRSYNQIVLGNLLLYSETRNICFYNTGYTQFLQKQTHKIND